MKCNPKTIIESTQKSEKAPRPFGLPKTLSKSSYIMIMCGALLITILSLTFFCRDANAEQGMIGEQLALRAILGEAEGEPYLGKVAIGEVLRTRGSVRGFYGAKAVVYRDGHYFRGSRPIGSVTVGEALKAWRESKHSNVSRGSNHFENVKAFGVPYWAASMVPTVKIGSHQFYREEF